MIEVQTKEQWRRRELRKWMIQHNLKPSSLAKLPSGQVSIWAESRSGFTLYKINHLYQIYKWLGIQDGWKRVGMT